MKLINKKWGLQPQAWAAACGLALVATALHAQGVQDAQEIVVTATRTPQKISDLVAEVTVLDRATLARSEGRSLVEVLSQVPGLQFTNNGGLGKTSSVFVRGLESRHVLLLVDGVRVGSATLNTASFDNLPLDAIERIEIVRGPMTSVYGSNAMGGVVQLFTRRAGPGLNGNAKIGFGSQGYGLAAGGVGFGAGGFALQAQVQHQTTDGISATNAQVPFGSFNADDDGYRQKAGSLRASWAFAPGWRAEALLLESRGKVQIDDGPGADARAGLRNSVQSLQVGGQVMSMWSSHVAFGKSVDVYDTLSSASAFSTLGATKSDLAQLSWENRLALPVGEAVLVLERQQQDVSRPGTPYTVSSRRINSAALAYNAQLGGHSLQTSLRQDRNSQFGNKTTGALAYAYALTPQWRAGGSYGTSFTAPSFNQLYFPGFSSPTLQPEEGRHAELFAQWSGGPHRVRLTAYRHRYDLFITSGPQPANVPNVEIDGVTLAWDAKLGDLSLSASFDETDPRNLSVGTSGFDKLLPRRAPRAFKSHANWQWGRFNVGGVLQAYSFRFDNAANTSRLPGYAVLDLTADWALSSDLTLGLRLNNVADTPYATVLGYNQAGREGFVTLRWAMR